ncbi:MAG: hypothetical protein ACYTHM_06900 [Planctomycetota bacterium]|jgi:quinol-cytochrome oxidoreductase complex cytochrome b subunit
MILLLHPGTKPEMVGALVKRLREAGVEAEGETAGDRILVRAPQVLLLAPEILEDPGIAKAIPVPEPGETGIRFFPDHLLRQGIAVCLVLAALILLATFLPPGLSDPADPMSAPPDVKPGWYFVALHQILGFFPGGWEFVGVLSIVVVMLVFLLFPVLDRSTRLRLGERPVAWIGIGLGVSLIVLTLWGVFS